jgi:hypothetical protein
MRGMRIPLSVLVISSTALASGEVVPMPMFCWADNLDTREIESNINRVKYFIISIVKSF